MKLRRDLGITQKTAWHLEHRIRQGWSELIASFFGPVEADETYIGGKEGNKHASKKLRAGRGAVGKTAVVGVKGGQGKWGVWGRKNGNWQGRPQPVLFRLVYNSPTLHQHLTKPARQYHTTANHLRE